MRGNLEGLIIELLLRHMVGGCCKLHRHARRTSAGTRATDARGSPHARRATRTVGITPGPRGREGRDDAANGAGTDGTRDCARMHAQRYRGANGSAH